MDPIAQRGPLLWRCAGCRRPNHGRCRPSGIFRSGDLETASSASGEGFRSAGAGQRTEGKIYKDYKTNLREMPSNQTRLKFQILLKQDWGRQKTTWVPVMFHSTVPRRNFRSLHCSSIVVVQSYAERWTQMDGSKNVPSMDTWQPGPFVFVWFALLLRWMISLWPYSGQGDDPIYGDYEAQRHWMEITNALPLHQWYR